MVSLKAMIKSTSFEGSSSASTDVCRSKYKFGRTLGAGTYGIVREAEGPDKRKVAIKIILKKNVKGNEQMVIDELRMLREMRHPHIVQFVDWFESRVSLSRLAFVILSS
jgi:calcium/calmodulin-dependent protein kinase I